MVVVWQVILKVQLMMVLYPLKFQFMKYFKIPVSISILLLINFFTLSSQSWNSFYHFAGQDELRILKMQIDESNNVYVSGWFTGSYETHTSHGFRDFFVAKLNSTGGLLWFRQIGGKYLDNFHDICYYNNSIYFVGGLQDTVFIENTDTLILNPTSRDVGLIKFSSNGSYLWGKNIAFGNNHISPYSIDIKNSNLIIVGNYINQVDFGGNSFIRSGTHNFILKLNLDGDFVWSKNIIGNNNATRITNTKIFEDGYYFTGYFRDSLYIDIGSIKSAYSNISDLFIYKTDINGNGLWIRKASGNSNDVSGSLTNDPYGNVYYTGYFQSNFLTIDSTSSIVSNKIIQNKGDFDIFIFKYNKNGVLQWAKNYGTPYREYAIDINERNNFLYLSGYYTNQIIFGNDTLVGNGSTDRNIFIGTFDLQGNMIKGDDIVGSDQGEDISDALVVDNSNEVFVSGYFKSATLYVDGEELVNSNTANYDGVIAKYTPPYSAVFTEIINPTCYAGNSGALKVTPYFGVPPYQYSWSHAPDPGINDSVATGLSAGPYFVTVTDARDSVTIANITLTQPAQLTNSEIITHISCCNGDDGAIDITPSGGITPYTYTWTSPDGSGVNPSTQDQSDISSGTYYLTLKDKNLCQLKDTFIVTQPLPITFGESTVDSIKIPPGGNGAINLVVSGGTPGYTYNWNGPGIVDDSSDSLKNLSIGGTYTVEVTDSKSCPGDTAFFVPSDTMLIANINSKTNVDCKGYSTGSASVVVLNGSGDYTYAWRNNTGNPIGGNEPFISGVPADKYYVNVTDNVSSKTAEASVIITEPANALVISSIIPTNLRCYNDNSGIVNLTVNGGTLPYSFLWNNGATEEDLVDIPASTYTVTVTDNNGCQDNDGTTVTQPPSLLSVNIIPDPVNRIYCYGELTAAAFANAGGGSPPYSYVWSDPGSQVTATATGLGAGDYTVTVTDFSLCTATDQVSITEPPEITVTPSYLIPTCAYSSDGRINPAVTGGTPTLEYEWNTGYNQRILDNIPAGDYSLTITDAFNCTKVEDFSLEGPDSIIIQTIDHTDPTCFGYNNGTISITATGGTGDLLYSVDEGVSSQNIPVFDTLQAGNYIVRITDINNCQSPDSSLSLDQPEGVDIASELTQDVTCYGGNDGVISINASGGAGSLEFSVDNGQTYQDNNGIFNNLVSGTYPVMIIDADNCEFPGSSLVINEPPAIDVTGQITEDISCAGMEDGSVLITATGGTGTLLYSINGGTDYLDNNGIFTDLTEGTYSVNVRDANNCDTLITGMTINNPDTLVIDTVNVTQATSGTGGAITLQSEGGTGAITFVALKPSSDSLVTGNGLFSDLQAGTYTIYAHDVNSCLSNMLNVTIMGEGGNIIIIYDAFSPNGDMRNDFWNIGNIEQFPDCKVKIINSWGNEVFRSDGYSEPWDGKYKGRDLPSGTYYYFIDLGDGSEVMTGPVNIVK